MNVRSYVQIGKAHGHFLIFHRLILPLLSRWEIVTLAPGIEVPSRVFLFRNKVGFDGDVMRRAGMKWNDEYVGINRCSGLAGRCVFGSWW